MGDISKECGFHPLHFPNYLLIAFFKNYKMDKNGDRYESQEQGYQ